MDRKPRIVLAVAVLAIIGATSGWAWQREEATKEARIRHLLRISGAGDMGKQMMDSLLDSFRAMPQLPDGFIERFRKEAKPEELIDLIVPIYDKHLSRKDVDELIKFYESRVGKKLVRVQPKIMAESMAAGQEWGQKVGMRVMQSLEKEQE